MENKSIGDKKENKVEYHLKNIFLTFFLAVQHYAVMSKNNASDSEYKITTLFYISTFIFILLSAGKDILLEISKNKKILQTEILDKNTFKKFATTTHNINFSFNQFTYTERGETQSFQLASIHKIVLFGNNSQNQSLNIYYDKDKIYTFYSDMKDWKALLERLNAHFSIKIDAKINNNKQVLYERKS